MKSIIVLLSLISSFAIAETSTFTVEGMHCSACKKMVSKKVCDDEAIKSSSESCEVKITDAKKQLGEIKIVAKKGATIDLTKVEAGVTAAGTEYKVIKKETK